MIVLSPLRIGRPVKDSSDFVEVNHVYRYDENLKKYEKRLVQVIWWEWRDYVLVENSGDYKRTSGFVVRDYRVIWASSSRPQKTMEIEPRFTRGKWVCLFYDKYGSKIMEIESGWKRETHTSFDVEIENRKTVPLNSRNRLKNR